MSNEDIKKLITELKGLRLREIEVLNSLERAIAEQNNTNNNSTDRGYNTHTANTVMVVEAEPATTNIYQVGDRVAITNSITRPLNRSTNIGDQTAVVTSVVGRRVYIRTSNNTNTWRAPQNLRFRRNNE
jgi:hypothetical protein